MIDQAAIESVNERLPDDFARSILTGALYALRGEENPMRLQQFAAGVREAFDYTLNTLAPNKDVESCSWYVQEPSTTKPTRMQRAIYATQGGLSPQYMDSLNIDVKELHEGFTAAFNEMHKRTHVRPETHVTDEATIRDFANMAIASFNDFFEAIFEAKHQVMQAVHDHLDQEVFDRFVQETIDELDELATHYTIDQIGVEDVEIVSIDSSFITYRLEGYVGVELQYGSDSDVRNDIGSVVDDQFPFKMTLLAPVATPYSDFQEDISQRSINTSSFSE